MFQVIRLIQQVPYVGRHFAISECLDYFRQLLFFICEVIFAEM